MKRYLTLSFIIFAVIFILICSTFILIFSSLASKDSLLTSSVSPSVIVVIDAGHGGEDGGAIGINGCLEKDINLSIAKKLSAILSGMGIKNILTRNTDTLLYDKNADFKGQKKHLDMQERLKITESYQNAIFVSKNALVPSILLKTISDDAFLTEALSR